MARYYSNYQNNNGQSGNYRGADGNGVGEPPPPPPPRRTRYIAPGYETWIQSTFGWQPGSSGDTARDFTPERRSLFNSLYEMTYPKTTWEEDEPTGSRTQRPNFSTYLSKLGYGSGTSYDWNKKLTPEQIASFYQSYINKYPSMYVT